MRGKPVPIDPDELAQLVANGVSAQRLCVRYGRSMSALRSVAARHGIKLKSLIEMRKEVKKIMANTPEKVMKKAVEDAQHTLAEPRRSRPLTTTT